MRANRLEHGWGLHEINPNPYIRMSELFPGHIPPPDRWFTFPADTTQVCSCGKKAVKGWWVYPKGITNSYCRECLVMAPENIHPEEGN